MSRRKARPSAMPSLAHVIRDAGSEGSPLREALIGWTVFLIVVLGAVGLILLGLQ